MSAPIPEGGWAAVQGAYYVGAGQTEAVWVAGSLVVLVAALAIGAVQEARTYRGD